MFVNFTSLLRTFHISFLLARQSTYALGKYYIIISHKEAKPFSQFGIWNGTEERSSNECTGSWGCAELTSVILRLCLN